MPVYSFKAIRVLDGAEITSGTINDALNAGTDAMKLAILAALLHDHPIAKNLEYHEIEVQMAIESR